MTKINKIKNKIFIIPFILTVLITIVVLSVLYAINLQKDTGLSPNNISNNVNVISTPSTQFTIGDSKKTRIVGLIESYDKSMNTFVIIVNNNEKINLVANANTLYGFEVVKTDDSGIQRFTYESTTPDKLNLSTGTQVTVVYSTVADVNNLEELIVY